MISAASSWCSSAASRSFCACRSSPERSWTPSCKGCSGGIRVALNQEEVRLGTHLAFLATVGSTSPYVGLFGTVWGIMNSFRSLANMSQATLSLVAPVSQRRWWPPPWACSPPIPAVIGYNRFSARVEELMKRIEAFSDELTSILHRAAQAQVTRP